MSLLLPTSPRGDYCHQRQDASTPETAHFAPRSLHPPCLSARPIQPTPILPLTTPQQRRRNRTPQHPLPDRRAPAPPRLQIHSRLDRCAPRRVVQDALLHHHHHKPRIWNPSPDTHRSEATTDNRAIMHAFRHHHLVPHFSIHSQFDPSSKSQPNLDLDLEVEVEVKVEVEVEVHSTKTRFLPRTADPLLEISLHPVYPLPTHHDPFGPRSPPLAARGHHPQHAHSHPAGTRVAAPDHQAQVEPQSDLVDPPRQFEVAREHVRRRGRVDRDQVLVGIEGPRLGDLCAVGSLWGWEEKGLGGKDRGRRERGQRGER